MSTKEAYVERAKAQIREWGAQIDLLVAKSATASATARVDYEKAVAATRSKRKAMKKKLHEGESAVGAAWDEVKIGLESAWKDVQTSYESAVAALRGK